MKSIWRNCVATGLSVLMLAGSLAFGAKTLRADEAKTVVYWSMWDQAEPQGQVIAQAAEAFTKETGIKVQVEFKGRSGIREGLEPALAAGSTIDLFDEDIDRVNKTFGKYLADLDEFVKSSDYEKTANAGLIKAVRDLQGGKIKSIPYQPNLFTFFCNDKIFEEAGVKEYPKTWQEFKDACAKIKEAGYIPISSDDAYILESMGYHMSRLVGEEETVRIIKERDWDSDAVKQFAKDYAELAELGYFSPNVAASVWPSSQNTELAVGLSAMYLNGSWLPNEVRETAGPDFKWGCFSYPTLEGGKTGLEALNFGAQVFAINDKSEVKAEAFKFIEYMTKGEWDKKLSEGTIGIPADTTNTEWPALLEKVKPVLDGLQTRWAWGAGAEEDPDITPMLKAAVQKLCGGQVDADGFIQLLKDTAK